MDETQNILVVDDDMLTCRLLEVLLGREGHQVASVQDGARALEEIRRGTIDLVLTDLHMPGLDGLGLLKQSRALDPDLPVLMLTGHTSVKGAIEATQLGAYDYLQKPIDPERLRTCVRNALESRSLRRRARLLDNNTPEDQAGGSWHGLVGWSEAMQGLYQRIGRAARYPTPVLITGESGTGKELVARAVHVAGPRQGQAFVAINGASIVESLFESLMFGHRRGSFTGAERDQRGLFEEADQGTLFLDEVGEMPLSVQARLLRVLETGEIHPVGAPRPRKVDVRLVSATNRDLRLAIREGRFREDLYYRLCGVSISLPPLRERREDVLHLAEHFLARIRDRDHIPIKGFDPGVLVRLSQYSWPGNVRQLRQVVESAAVISRTPWIEVEDLPPYLQDASTIGTPAAAVAERLGEARPKLPRTLLEVEAEHIRRVLSQVDGNRTHCARLLGVSRHTLYRLLRKHQIDIEEGLRSAG